MGRPWGCDVVQVGGAARGLGLEPGSKSKIRDGSTVRKVRPLRTAVLDFFIYVPIRPPAGPGKCVRYTAGPFMKRDAMPVPITPRAQTAVYRSDPNAVGCS